MMITKDALETWYGTNLCCPPPREHLRKVDAATTPLPVHTSKCASPMTESMYCKFGRSAVMPETSLNPHPGVPRFYILPGTMYTHNSKCSNFYLETARNTEQKLLLVMYSKRFPDKASRLQPIIIRQVLDA